MTIPTWENLIDMWDNIWDRALPEMRVVMKNIEKKKGIGLSPGIVSVLTEMFDVNGVVEMDVIVLENGYMICNVYYDPDTDEMRDSHWRKILSRKARETVYNIDHVIDFTFRRKKKNPFGRRFPNAR